MTGAPDALGPEGSDFFATVARNSSSSVITRLSLFRLAMILPIVLTGIAGARAASRVSITDFQAVPDGRKVNTTAIQAAIDRVAAQGGGTVIVPKGVFVSGALFFKPGVNLHLDPGAVLRCSTDLANFPPRRTRIEGHFEAAFNPALINADGCDGFHLTGEGTLDGAGRPIWDLFWKLRRAAQDPNRFPNVSVPRARLALIENSAHVVIDGITFKDSQFWNLHLYRCRDVQVRHTRFQVPDDYKQAPSTDGIDIDSSQDVTIEGCTFSVTDDCIAAKGSKGPDARDGPDNPPVERIRVRHSTFRRGGAMMCLGSEATTVRDVVVENCTVTGSMPLLRCKLRPDTSQRYEQIVVRNITVDNPRGAVLAIAPWSQYFDLQGRPRPKSTVHDITISGVKGRTGSLALIEPNPGQTSISDITLRDIDLEVRNEHPKISDQVANLKLENIVLNGKPFVLPPPPSAPADRGP